MYSRPRLRRQLTDAATISAVLFPLTLSAVMAFDRHARRRRQDARDHNREIIAAELSALQDRKVYRGGTR
jgi:hypothetical protein